MTVLGIETSTVVCSVGLFREGTPPVERALAESHIHSEKLLTLIQEVLRQAGISLGDVDCVAVSSGPGSFTGLRIGFSTAKGLCYSLDKPLVLVPTFEAIARSARDQDPGVGRIVVMIDAKREELYVGDFRVHPSAVSMISPVKLLPAGQAVEFVGDDHPVLVVTDAVERLRDRLGNKVVMHDVQQFCRGSVVARIGHERALGKDFADVASAEPVYLKDFVVRTAATS